MQVFGFSLGFSDSLEMSTKEEHVLWYVYDIFVFTNIIKYLCIAFASIYIYISNYIIASVSNSNRFPQLI